MDKSKESLENPNHLTFHHWKSKQNGKYYWQLRARNGRVIADAGNYDSLQACLEGIALVKTCKNAPVFDEDAGKVTITI